MALNAGHINGKICIFNPLNNDIDLHNYINMNVYIIIYNTDISIQCIYTFMS